MLGCSLSHHSSPFLAILTFSPISSIFTIYIFIFRFSFLIPLYSLFIRLSFPGPHFTLLCCPSTGPIFLSPSLTPLFPAYQSPTGTFVLNSPFDLSPFLCSAIHSTSIHACTHRFPFCSSTSSFQNMPHYLCHAHSVALGTCLPCMCYFCLP